MGTYDVLLAIDDNVDRALAQAGTVADLPDAPESVRAILLHVFEENPAGASVHRVQSVRRAQERLEDRGVPVELAETSGDPATEILAVADERDVDAVAVTGRKRTPTGKVLFGSVTQSVVLESERPVIVCNAPHGGE